MLCCPIRKVPFNEVHLTNKAHLLREDEEVWFKDRDGTKLYGYISSLPKDHSSITIKVQVPHLGVLSGTPLTNRPSELWTVLNLIWPQIFPAFTPFAWEFCEPEMTPYGWKYNGASNLDILHKRLTRVGMIRRRKKDVLKDLPKKQRFVVPLDIKNTKEYEQAKTDFINWLHRQDAAKAERASKAEKITQMAYLKRLSAMGKLAGVYDWIDNFLEESEDKLLVGCMHHSVIDALYARYKAISLAFSGKTAEKDRRKVIHEFRKNPKKRIIIGQIQAIGTGVDGLQSVACTSAVVELPWDPGTLGQFDDRIHRIGQSRNVSIYYLVARGTLEESLCKLLQEKQNVLTRTLDGEEHLSKMSIDIYSRLERELLKGDRR
jgi:SNF2 family DNA or RNA helicase